MPIVRKKRGKSVYLMQTLAQQRVYEARRLRCIRKLLHYQRLSSMRIRNYGSFGISGSFSVIYDKGKKIGKAPTNKQPTNSPSKPTKELFFIYFD